MPKPLDSSLLTPPTPPAKPKKGKAKAAATATPAAATPAPVVNPVAPPPAAVAPAVPAAPAAPVTPYVEARPPRKILYPEVSVDIRHMDKPIDGDLARRILGWEDEKQYADRLVRANPGLVPEACVYRDDFLLKDFHGVKVRCHHNVNNRPMDEKWMLGLAQTILSFDWAGPSTIPGETINGSTITIDRTGEVMSGQHSLIATVIADQMYLANPAAYPKWTRRPFIETIVVTGISNNKRVIMTVDNCKARSEADVFYTGDLFAHLTTSDRRICAGMISTGADFLWKRTDTKGYKTHTEIVAFVERHPRIVKALEFIFRENSAAAGRPISTQLWLSPGMAVALLYLMGASATDGDEYRNGLPPSESSVDWGLYDTATEFFAMAGKSAEFQPLREALAEMIDDDEEISNQRRKICVIAKAWDLFSHKLPITAEDLEVAIAVHPTTGKRVIADKMDFGGIDCPEKSVSAVSDPPPPPPASIEQSKAEIERERAKAVIDKMTPEERKARAQEAVDRIKAMRGGAKPAVK